MRTITKQIDLYAFEELSKSVQVKVLKKEIEMELSDFFEWDEQTAQELEYKTSEKYIIAGLDGVEFTKNGERYND